MYWRTAYPTITWWDSSNYSTAAATLGVSSAPGSLLLTLLGWPLTKLAPAASIAHVLNLFAGLLGAIAVALVFFNGFVLSSIDAVVADGRTYPRTIGAAVGALAFAFTTTPWDYAVKFTPYVLTIVFTGVILSVMLIWWRRADEPHAWKWLALLGFLVGLDFSVHRTNALLLPGMLCWILIRRPRTLLELRALLGGTSGLFLGLAVQLLVIPMAAVSRSPLDFNDPSNLTRFWDYITLKQLGGSFLLKLYPRKSDLLTSQTADVVHVLRANFLHATRVADALTLLPMLAALLALTVLYRTNRRLAIALTLLVILQFASTVLYFNIPAEYFRSFDRHYLPICVTLAVLSACGFAIAAEWVVSAFEARAAPAMASAVLAGAAMVACRSCSCARAGTRMTRRIAGSRTTGRRTRCKAFPPTRCISPPATTTRFP